MISKKLFKHINKRLILCALALMSLGIGTISFVSCNQGCEQIRENYLLVDFVSTAGRTLSKINYLSLSADKVVTETNAITAFEDIELNLNPDATSTQFIFSCTYSDYGDIYTVTDTVDITYSVTPKFLDIDCGCTVTFDITGVTTTHNLLSNVIVNQPTVLTDSGTNITFEY